MKRRSKRYNSIKDLADKNKLYSLKDAVSILKKMSNIPGVTMAYPKQSIRLDQVRFSLEKLKNEKGVGTEDIARRMVDFGIQEYFTSHHPWVVPEPFLPEPCETYSKEDIDYWVSIIKHVCEEAYENPEIARTAPHNQPTSKIKQEIPNDPDRWAMTWRAYTRKNKILS